MGRPKKSERAVRIVAFLEPQLAARLDPASPGKHAARLLAEALSGFPARGTLSTPPPESEPADSSGSAAREIPASPPESEPEVPQEIAETGEAAKTSEPRGLGSANFAKLLAWVEGHPGTLPCDHPRWGFVLEVATPDELRRLDEFTAARMSE